MPRIGLPYIGPMRETLEELNELQALLDVSLSHSTAHLRSIVTERTLTAEQLTQILTGMCTLALSTVTAKDEPRVARTGISCTASGTSARRAAPRSPATSLRALLPASRIFAARAWASSRTAR
jgi:hypothetical protein